MDVFESSPVLKPLGEVARGRLMRCPTTPPGPEGSNGTGHSR